MLRGASRCRDDLGEYCGADLYAAELRWLMAREFARTAEDVLWRRSKLGLRLTAAEVAAVESWMASQPA